MTNGSTRICIKNLPPDFREQDLRQFLFQQKDLGLQITDCVILRNAQNHKSRRVAFVGFKTSEMANVSVQKLHKSYCKTSRLTVELAKPPATSLGEKSADGGAGEGRSQATTKSRTNDEATPTKSEKDMKLERKKKEFLAAMGVDVDTENGGKSGKNKFWSNDDLAVSLPDDQFKQSIGTMHDEEGSSSDSDSSKSSDSDSVDSADPLLNHQDKQPVGNAVVHTDLDFLRSKQKTVEDLDSLHDLSRDAMEEDDDIVPMKTSRDENPCAVNDESSTESIDIGKQDGETDKKDTSIDEVDSHVSLDKTRLFLRNLPFDTTEEDVQNHFGGFGTVEECHLPSDDEKRSKGFGFVRFSTPQQALAAKNALDGFDFQGRIMHIHFAKPAASSTEDDLSKLSYKDRKEKERQTRSENSQGWSASFVRGDAVVETLVTRMGIDKSDVLGIKDGLSAGDAAVRMALGETAVIEENRKFFEENGYDMDALVSMNSNDNSIERSKTAILAKNLPNNSTREELLQMFSSLGETPTRLLLSPSKTIALIEYSHHNDAKRAFRKLAYRRFKSLPLYLERAPLKAVLAENGKATESQNPSDLEKTLDETIDSPYTGGGSIPTLYVRNLNFATTEESLKNFFQKHCKVRSVRIPKKSAAVSKSSAPPKQLSMGYGFVEFFSDSDMNSAVQSLKGQLLDGFALEVQTSSPSQSSIVAPPKGKSPSKITVRNVPFEASRKDLLQLFGSYGQLKKVRLPKKFDGSHRGFAFVDYVSHKEAEAAMKALSRTHLYGRHLVLEWSTNEEESVDNLRMKAKRDLPAGLPISTGKKTRFS